MLSLLSLVAACSGSAPSASDEHLPRTWVARDGFGAIRSDRPAAAVGGNRNTCEGPRAYAGVASAYHEVVTGLDRLTDSEWEKMAQGAEDVAWRKPILP